MNYWKALKSVQRWYEVHDGYNGSTAILGLTFEPETGKAIAVANHSCFTAGTNHREYSSLAELLYYFDNHFKMTFAAGIRKASEPAWYAEKMKG